MKIKSSAGLVMWIVGVTIFLPAAITLVGAFVWFRYFIYTEPELEFALKLMAGSGLAALIGAAVAIQGGEWRKTSAVSEKSS